jgi:hypothetical protein
MAHEPVTRSRARELYLSGRGVAWIAERTGVSRATLQRWKKDDAWDEMRSRYRSLEREAADLVLTMTQAARESGDPQQAYAAMQAAELARMTEPQPVHPSPAAVAKLLLSELASHEQLGPLVRRHRDEVIERVLRRVETLEPA